MEEAKKAEKEQKRARPVDTQKKEGEKWEEEEEEEEGFFFRSCLVLGVRMAQARPVGLSVCRSGGGPTW